MTTRHSGQHTFVVPAYGTSPWLDPCLESLQQQTSRSPIVITTSTPSRFLEEIAHRRGVELTVNPERRGIGADWNFALSRARGPWVTLAHQDDWYAPTYVERCLAKVAGLDGVTLAFSSAMETFGDSDRPVRNVRVKRLMCAGVFLGAGSIRSIRRKQLLLSFGNPIPCPAVMINRTLTPGFAFSEQLQSNLDWVAWLDLARRPGTFVYVREPLVHRVIHEEAATVVGIEQRAAEDEHVLRQLWPRPLADLLVHLYARSIRQYDPLGARQR